MSSEALDEREFELINIVGGDLAANQRDLSRRMNLSLGLTNMLLRRLVTKGYIRITQLNRKKVQYILTTKGFGEKIQKSIKYTLKTINSIGLIKSHLARILNRFAEKDNAKFYILGESDLAGLVEQVLEDTIKHKHEIIHLKSLIKPPADGVVLICKEGISVRTFNPKIVNLIEELARLHAEAGISNEA
jgi:DNA-binding MarR family transcriptional regulator